MIGLTQSQTTGPTKKSGNKGALNLKPHLSCCTSHSHSRGHFHILTSMWFYTLSPLRCCFPVPPHTTHSINTLMQSVVKPNVIISCRAMGTFLLERIKFDLLKCVSAVCSINRGFQLEFYLKKMDSEDFSCHTSKRVTVRVLAKETLHP